MKLPKSFAECKTPAAKAGWRTAQLTIFAIIVITLGYVISKLLE